MDVVRIPLTGPHPRPTGLRRLATCLVPLLWALLPGGASAQLATLQGRVVDAEGAAVFAAAVQLFRPGEEAPFRTTETDRVGYYRLEDLPAGRYDLRAGRLGFTLTTRPLEIRAGAVQTVDLELQQAALELEGISVDVERSRERARFEDRVGLTSQELSGADLEAIPGVAESDPLRAVEVLPGVVSTSDFSSAFNVRGGSADQNLILLDGLPIFNPFHLGGLFSVFNADMVARAELFAGGFPAEYGGRVSSVLAIESDAGDGDWDVDAGISLLASRVAVGGGLPDTWDERLGLSSSRWRVSGRRSYFDLLLKPVTAFPYHLTDLQGIFEGWTPGGGRLTVTGYTGRDVIDFTQLDDEDFPLKVDWGWGNDVFGARWSQPRPDGSSFDVRAGLSRFSTDLVFPDFGDTEFRSAVNLLTLSGEAQSRPWHHWTLKGGVKTERLTYDNRAASGGTEFAAGRGNGWLLGGFVQGTWRTAERWVVELGTRVDGWLADPGRATMQLGPRVAVKRFFLGRDWAAKASVGRYTQFLHSIRDEELPLGLDVWVLSGERAPVVTSEQVQFGVEGYPMEDWFVSVEAYGRDFDGVITTNLAEDPNDDLDDFLPGTGRSYGVDLFVRKSGEGITGWLALSWLRATRTFPDFNSGLDPAPLLEYAPIFDRRLDADLVLTLPLPRGIEGGLRWNLGTGLPYTRPLGGFAYYSPQLTLDGRLQWPPDGGLGDYGVILGPRNGDRYPAYHRLDVSFRKTFVKPWGRVTPHLDILNVYNRKNVLFYFYEYDSATPTRSGVSMFPVLPTFGVEINFR
ncbi:MAG: TonB-dependent receptor [Gemmatimonadetes bacterium]|nr:TonB-dependent receptor [Gemmatimonadota bacterium]